MKEDISDTELVAAFKAGDTEALGLLMGRHKDAVYGYLLRLTGRADAADDLFQEVFLKLVKNPSSYSEREKFKAWLFTVARNAAMDHFRRDSSRRETPLEGDGEKAGAADLIASAEPGPAEAFYSRDLAGRIDRALASLSEDQREVFYLRHYSQLSFKEIAELLKVPIGTVLARMSRAAARLREKLGDGTAD